MTHQCRETRQFGGVSRNRRVVKPLIEMRNKTPASQCTHANQTAGVISLAEVDCSCQAIYRKTKSAVVSVIRATLC